MSEINILLYEQYSRVNLRYYLSETVLNTNLSIDRNFTHRVRTPAPNVVSFSHFQMKFMAEK